LHELIGCPGAENEAMVAGFTGSQRTATVSLRAFFLLLANLWPPLAAAVRRPFFSRLVQPENSKR
jgi:hypothetical protein